MSWQSSPITTSHNEGHHHKYIQQLQTEQQIQTEQQNHTEQQIQTEQPAKQQKWNYKVWSRTDFLIIPEGSGQIWVNPWTWVTLFGKRILPKSKKRTSVEGLLSPRPRFFEALDRGSFQPSVEVLKPRPRVSKYLDRGIDLGRGIYLGRGTFSKKITNRGRAGPKRHFQSLDRGTELDRGTATIYQKQPHLLKMSEPRGNHLNCFSQFKWNLNFFFINL